MYTTEPTFPPLLSGHAVDALTDPFDHAVASAKSGEAGAGDLYWSMAITTMHFALVLEPDVTRQRCSEMVFVAMVAFGDATGAIVPPEIAITYQWPNRILMNDGQIGHADLLISEEETDGVPDWMVLSLDIAIQPEIVEMNPGYAVHKTTMWDEGCGDITPEQLLESVSRHLLNAIHIWSEDGFRPFHGQWTGRIRKARQTVENIHDEEQSFIGIDEYGNALLAGPGDTVQLNTEVTLTSMRNR